MISRAVQLTRLTDIEHLSQRVIRILGQNPSPMTLQGTNSYLIGTGEKRVLIDTSSPESAGYLDLLQKVLTDVKAKIQTIVVTHHHYDHLGMVADVLKANNLTVPNVDVVKLRRKGDEAYDFNFSELNISKEIAVDGATLRPLATPGHCDDHSSFCLLEENAMFVGDAVLGEGSTTFDDLYEYMRSLRYMASLKPLRLYPGHGPVIADGEQRLLQYVAHRDAREKQIVGLMLSRADYSFSIKEMVSSIYPDIDNDIIMYAAGENVHLHLEKLLKEGKVCRTDNKSDAVKNDDNGHGDFLSSSWSLTPAKL